MKNFLSYDGLYNHRWKLYIFDDHDQELKLDAEGQLLFGRRGDVGRAHVGAHDLQDRWLDVRVGDSLYVAISNCLG